MSSSEYVPIKWRNPSSHPTSEQAAAIAPLVELLEDCRHRRYSLIPTRILPGGQAANLRPAAPGGLIHASLPQLMERITEVIKTIEFSEPLYDAEVWVDGDIAVSWTPFDVYCDIRGKDNIRHVGTNIVMYARPQDTGEWIISGIADNGREPAPGEPPRRYTGPKNQDPEEEKAVLAVVTQLLDSFKNKNKDLSILYDLCLPEIKWALFRDGKMTWNTVPEFIERVGMVIAEHDVVEIFEDPVVRVDHDVALVWGPFKCFIDGKLNHYGSHIHALAKRDDRWVFTLVGDNRILPKNQ